MEILYRHDELRERRGQQRQHDAHHVLEVAIESGSLLV
jgi:hypothetical protein